MKNFFDKIIEAIAAWLFSPKPKHTYTSCDADKDDKERQGTRTDIKVILPESKKKQGAAVH